MAEALSQLACVYAVQNNPQQGMAYTERAMAIAQEVGDVILVAKLRHYAANRYAELGALERALEIHQQILKQTEGYGDLAGAAITRYQIGKIFATQGRYAEALEYQRQALAGLDATNVKRAISGVLIDMSCVYLAQEKYAEALQPAERAVSLSRQTGRQLDLWWALTSLGYSHLGLNRPLEARQAFTEAVSIIEKLRTQTAGGVEERQRYFEWGLRAHHGLLSLLVMENQTQEALVSAERAKARALLDALRQGRISVQKAMTEEEQEQERLLKAEMTRLNTQLTRATQSDKPDAERVGEIKSRLEKARLNYEAFQTSLYAAHPELKVHRGEASISKAEELAALLPDAASALLEYIVTNDRTYLFAVTKAAGMAKATIPGIAMKANNARQNMGPNQQSQPAASGRREMRPVSDRG